MSEEQLSLWGGPVTQESPESGKEKYLVHSFSAGGAAGESERQRLEKKYEQKLCLTEQFNRQSVSYQLSKKDALHSWLRYKEGYSAELVTAFLNEMGAKPGDLIMDPFMGSGTTALVCRMRGIDSVGFDVMPLSGISIQAKQAVYEYEPDEIRAMIRDVDALEMPEDYQERTPCITITDSAYPEYTERYLQYITQWNQSSKYSKEAKNLLTLCIVNSLERISYTTKSGQYLSWDCRSRKVMEANAKRTAAGKPPLAQKFVRKEIPAAKDTILAELHRVLQDIEWIQSQSEIAEPGKIRLIENSALYELPRMDDGILAGVITSPPYCNRYDYTRTYALELVYLGLGEAEVRDMRQALLSCTVESKSKLEQLREFYESIGCLDRYEQICAVIRENKTFREIMEALNQRDEGGELNNNGILRMVEGYFTELAFVYAELFRLCRKGSLVVFVNDNVRYGGEVIPVDFLSCELAEQFGFRIKRIDTLKQQKGNSSQQMAKYGRVPLRKSITVWEKPE